jgi:prepilin-type N-terminal cleavage/methylation domain-containing protein
MFNNFKNNKLIAISAKKISSGFTLIELLMVVLILSILATFLIAILDPQVQLNKAKNAKISSDIKTIDTAIWQYFIDNQVWPASNLDEEYRTICDTNRLVDSILNCSYEEVNLSKLVPDYLSMIPIHPDAYTGDKYKIKIENGEPVIKTMYYSTKKRFSLYRWFYWFFNF